MARIKYYIPGISLILAGIFIVVFPEILVALLASMVIMAGIGTLYIGKRLSESEKDYKDMYGDIITDDFVENDRTFKKPLFRYYRRWF